MCAVVPCLLDAPYKVDSSHELSESSPVFRDIDWRNVYTRKTGCTIICGWNETFPAHHLILEVSVNILSKIYFLTFVVLLDWTSFLFFPLRSVYIHYCLQNHWSVTDCESPWRKLKTEKVIKRSSPGHHNKGHHIRCILWNYGTYLSIKLFIYGSLK